VSVPQWKVGPFQIGFRSQDVGEPPHVHVWSERGHAKVWLQPVTLARSHGFGSHDLDLVLKVVTENAGWLIAEWDRYWQHA
jgi:hypothetical protein